MNDDNQVKFDSSVNKIGGSYYLLIPPELANYLDITEQDTLKTQPENGEHGPYIASWNPEQQANVDGNNNS